MRQSEKVLAYIQRHGSITPFEAFERLRITRLAAVVFHLKKCGYAVQTIMRTKVIDGETIRWAEYKINEPLTAGTDSGSEADADTLPGIASNDITNN